MRRPWLVVLVLVLAGLAVYALAELVGQREPTVTLTEVPSPPVLPSPVEVVICHQAPGGRIDFCRRATCRGQLCLPGPTVTP